MKKKKEDLRNQILTKVKSYRNKRGIHFFNKPVSKSRNKSHTIDDNDIEVLLIRLNKSKKILVTTKYLFLINKSTTIKIEGKEIDRFDYMEFINLQKASEIKQIYLKFKIGYRIGDYRIVKKDGSYIEINFRKTKLADCLNDCIKKLKFIANKYEGY